MRANSLSHLKGRGKKTRLFRPDNLDHSSQQALNERHCAFNEVFCAYVVKGTTGPIDPKKKKFVKNYQITC